jgi:hypothetical protein
VGSLGIGRLQGHLLLGSVNLVVDSPLELVQLGVVDQQVGHRSFVDRLANLAWLLDGARIYRQSLGLLDLVDVQLIEDVAVLGQPRKVLAVPYEIAVARVVGCEELQPRLDSCTTYPEAVAELPVHLLNALGAAWAEDDNV